MWSNWLKTGIQLEVSLGVKLFERTHRGLKLKKAGTSLYHDAKYILWMFFASRGFLQLLILLQNMGTVPDIDLVEYMKALEISEKLLNN